MAPRTRAIARVVVYVVAQSCGEPSMRHRRSKLFALVLVLAAAIGGAGAQEFAFGWDPRTGDDWVDERLTDINGYGYRYREAFIDEIVRYHGAPRGLVYELVVDRRWAPGDVYYACALARIVGRPCRYVVDEWNRDHGQGWGEVAKRLGIEPGSDEFHRLKRGFVPSYDRWNRPLELDAELRRAYPDRKDRSYAWSEKEGAKSAAAQNKGRPARNVDGRGKSKAKGKD
jgi:hypothetical protein